MLSIPFCCLAALATCFITAPSMPFLISVGEAETKLNSSQLSAIFCSTFSSSAARPARSISWKHTHTSTHTRRHNHVWQRRLLPSIYLSTSDLLDVNQITESYCPVHKTNRQNTVDYSGLLSLVACDALGCDPDLLTLMSAGTQQKAPPWFTLILLLYYVEDKKIIHLIYRWNQRFSHLKLSNKTSAPAQNCGVTGQRLKIMHFSRPVRIITLSYDTWN